MEEDDFKNLSKQYSHIFGDIVIEKGFVTEKQISEALAEQAEDDFSNEPHRFAGSILFEHGWITKKQIDIVLYELYESFEEEDFIKWMSHSPCVDQLREEDLCKILLKMCRGNSTDE